MVPETMPTPQAGEEQAALELVLKAWSEGLRPESTRSIVEWIEANRVLSSISSATPGPYRFQKTPYLREIAEVLSPSCPIQRVAVRKGAQIGFSEFAVSVVGYLMDQVPCPIIYLLPTTDLCKSVAHQRLQPMIDSSARLAERVSEAKAQHGKFADSVRLKQFPGGILALLGANSPAGLRTMTARYVMKDEVDGYPPQVGEEGDPSELVDRAARSFGGRRKIFEFSTPTFLGRSRIQRAFEAGDQRSFVVPCPHCGHFQRLFWTDEKTGKRGIEWSGEGPEREVWYRCQACAAKIDESSKEGMLAAGVWRPKFPERSDWERSYEVSALYASAGNYSWREAVAAFQKAKDEPEKLRVFVNHTLGEPWEERGDAPPWEELFRRREDYPIGTVPKGGYLLTAGVDVQQNRIECEVVAWGPRLESWSVAYFELEGDVASDAPWDALDEVLVRQYPMANGGALPIRVACVDSGYATNTVYAYCRNRRPGLAFAVRGMPSVNVLVAVPNWIDITTRGRKVRRGVQLWGVGVDVAKRELYGFLRGRTPLKAGDKVPVGFCHFPQYGEGHFKQLTAEQLMPRKDPRGFVKYEWVKVYERNERLDCRNYARAAASIVGVDRFSDADWARAAGGYRTTPPAQLAAPDAPRGAGYWDRFRRGGQGRWHAT